MSLQQATIEQLLEWQADIVHEIARRASTTSAPATPQPPWLTQAARQAPPQPQPEQPPRWTPPQQEPKRRPAIAAGMNDRGEPTDSLMSQTFVQREPARLPPGTVYETGATDPALAEAFHRLPARPDGVQPVNGNGAGIGAVRMEPG